MFARSLRALAFAVLAIGAASAVPAAAKAQSGEDQPRIDALIGELRTLIERGEEKREADPWFLQDLRALVRKYDWPWQNVVYDQSFLEGGNDNLPPGWQPIQGRYRMEPNAGYRTMVETRPEQRGQRSSEEVVGALVGTLLSKALNKNGGNDNASSQSRYTSALAATENAGFSNAFAVTVRLSIRSMQNTLGRVGFGPYQGDATGGGYRLYYLTGSTPGERRFELVRRSSRGTVSTIEFYQGDLGIEDGQEHEILWTRDREGNMTVSVDGTAIISANDRSFSDPFDGIAFVNTGGDAAVSYMKIEGAG